MSLNNLHKVIKLLKYKRIFLMKLYLFKKKYRNLGEYVANRKESQSIIDFSHDEIYQEKINEIIKLKFFIDDQNVLKKKI